MMDTQVPYLCGGTFFVLLLRAKRSGRSKKELQKYGSDGYTNTALLAALIMMFDSKYQVPAGTSMGTNTSLYKKCEISSAECLPFTDRTLINAFDRKIKTAYSNELSRMAEVTDIFLTTEKEEKINELVYGVLNLIKDDNTILPTDEFYAIPGGEPITKATLLGRKEFNLPALLLGVWHFILMHRADNNFGQATISAWHTRPSEKGNQHTFVSTIGDSYSHDIIISTTCENTDGATGSDDADELTPACDAVEAEVIPPSPAVMPSVMQNIQNQFNITQSGNGINIGYAEKVEIRDGKVVTLK